MADRTPRIAHSNLAVALATVITASSADAGFPVGWLRNHSPTMPWRSRLGWNVVLGWTDQLSFLEDANARLATITPGNYATGAAYATAVAAALNSAPGKVNTYAVSYDAVTKKATIARNTGTAALALPNLTGAANVAGRSAHRDLGYTTVDKTGSVSYLADVAAYKSREWVRFDLGSAQNVTVGIAHKHNMGAAHTLQLLGKAASDVWLTPGVTKTLAGDDASTKRLLFFTANPESYRYWLLLFDDVENTAGFSEMAVPYIGTTFQTERGMKMGRRRAALPLTTITRADRGAVQKTIRPAPTLHSFQWSSMTRTERDAYQAIEDARPHVFMAFDPDTRPGVETLYGVLEGATQFEEGIGDRWYPAETVFGEDRG